MARGRRKAAARIRLNLEAAGIAAFGLALLLGIALAAPARSGAAGAVAASALHHWFGAIAPLVPLIIATVGAVIFLEINVPRAVGTTVLAAVAYFLLIDAWYSGGAVGRSLWHWFSALLGTTGARALLLLLAALLTIALFNLQVKRLIGWVIGRFRDMRIPRPQLSISRGHANLQEAFDLPAAPKRPPVARPVALEQRALPIVAPRIEPIVQTPPPAPSEPSEEYEPPPTTQRTYRLPDLGLFDPPQNQTVDDSSRAHILEDTLASFGIGASVTHTERGPSVTRYELRPERGVKISRIAALADDIALALAATAVRIEAPIPGKSAVGIEVPNTTVSIVAIRELLEALPSRGTIPPLNVALGKDITGRPVIGDLGKMPHLLVAGATGSGKSVCLNAMLASLLVSARPDQVQLLLIDPKRVEFTVYNGTPHLIKDVICDPRLAAGALLEMTKEMDSRYERFAKAGVRKIEEYNAKYPDERLPYVVIVIDELADLMLVAPAKVETTICRIAQLARATGIHLVVATQRPSVDVITGIIKANIPSRISFAVSSQVDSRTILDMGGAERLLGRGDMLYLPIDAPKPVRAQGALITGAEVGRLVSWWSKQARPENLLEVDVLPVAEDGDTKNVDPLCYEAARFLIETNYASTAQLQSRFQIGHPRAVRLMKQLEDFKVVGPHEGTKPRRILIGFSDLETLAPRLARDAALDESTAQS